jgi:transcriptional regulator with XRE-family HTH domain
MKAQKGAGRSRAQNVDRYVGARLREYRIMRGMTQHQLAEAIGIADQQTHKYEKGINRISAGRLYQIARVLGVDINEFYKGVQGERRFIPTPQQRMLRELISAFVNIPTQERREALAHLARALAEPNNEEATAG